MDQNEMLYSMFLQTLNQMNEEELQKSLLRAKNVLSENDYEKLLDFIENEKKKKGQ